MESEKEKIKKERIKALVIGGVIGLILVLIGTLLVLIFSKESGDEASEIDESLFAREETQIAIFVAPTSAEIKIDEEVYRNGAYKFAPGIHTAQITATGYKPRVYNFEVKPDRITLLYDYLEKESGDELTEKDIDILRYLSNDDETTRKIEEYMLKLPENFSFSSASSSPIRNFGSLREFYGEEINEYSYKLTRETLDAYFYFARSATKNVRLDEDSFEKIKFQENNYLTTTEFKVVADGKENYRVKMEITRSQAEPERAYEIWRVTILTEAGTALFQYNGRFTYADSVINEEYVDGVNFD